MTNTDKKISLLGAITEELKEKYDFIDNASQKVANEDSLMNMFMIYEYLFDKHMKIYEGTEEDRKVEKAHVKALRTVFTYGFVCGRSYAKK